MQKTTIIIPQSLFKEHGLTAHQAGFLSLLYYNPEFGQLTNKQLDRLANPHRDPHPDTAAYHIRKLKRKGLLVDVGRNGTRKLELTLAARKAIRDVKNDPVQNKYIGVPVEDWLTGGSIARRIHLALHRTLVANHPDLANPYYVARTLCVTPDAARYHQRGTPLKNFVTPLKNFCAYNIYNNHFAHCYSQNDYHNAIDKSIASGLRPAESTFPLVEERIMVPDQYYDNDSQLPTKPKPRSKPFSYSMVRQSQRRQLKTKNLEIPPTHLAELESLASLPHIAQHRPNTRAMYDSCKVIYYLKTGLRRHMSPAMIDKVWDDLKWRKGADRAKLEEVLDKKWSREERLALFRALNNSLDPAYGYRGKRQKISLSEAFYNVDYGFSQLIKVAVLPPEPVKKKEPTPVQVPEDLKEMAEAILKITNQPKPTFRFVDMLHEIKQHWEENVKSRLTRYGVSSYTYYSWWNAMVKFITWDCNDDPKWPYFKPGTSTFARWEEVYLERIHDDVKNKEWRRYMEANRERVEIEGWRRYMEDEGVYFKSFEEAQQVWRANYSR